MFGAVEEHQRGNVFYVKHIANVAGVVHVDFVDDEFPFVFAGHFSHQRFYVLTRVAPIRVKVNDAGRVPLVTEAFVVVNVCDFVDKLGSGNRDNFAR